MLLALMLSSPSASADEPRVRVDFEIWLPTRAEPGPYGWSDRANRTYFGRTLGADAPDIEGTEVDEGKLSMACNLERGSLQVAVRYVPADYPEHLPEELQCPVGRYDAHVRILTRRPLYEHPDELRVDAVTGAEVRRYPIGRRTMSEDHTAFALPADIAWVAQQVPALRRGRWADTTCTVTTTEPPTLVVHHTDEVSDGTGRCELVDAAGVAHTVPIHILSVPIAP